MSPKNKKKLNIQRRKLDKLDNRLLSLIKIRTEIIKKVIFLKKNKKDIVDKKRIDCGWPASQRTEACEDFEEAKIVLTRMRAEAEAEIPSESSVTDGSEF